MMKTAVLEAPGEASLHRPAAVNAALAANDRIKYAFALLQTAAAHADDPAQPIADLRRERTACGIADRGLDTFAEAARREGSRYQIPGAARLLKRIAADMRQMSAPAIEANGGSFSARLDALLDAMPDARDDMLDAASLAAMTRAGTPGRDSLHQLVMDLHKALNAQQTALAEETIDGASVYGLTPDDQGRVAAFMAGVNRTAPLKFGHPGLTTTATRCNGTLVIQNDIGTTDAHVIVVHVNDLENRILLENYFLPGDLEAQIAAFVDDYNYRRYHESIDNLTPADVYFRRGPTILAERERIKRQTIAHRRLQHRLQAA
jgi:hypothetical protein